MKRVGNRFVSAPTNGGEAQPPSAFVRPRASSGRAAGPSLPRANPAPRPKRTRAPAPSEPGRAPLVRLRAVSCGTRARPPPPPGDGPAPSEPEAPRRPGPGPGAQRTRASAPRRLRARRGRDVRPRTARDLIVKEQPISSQMGGPAFSESPAGCESAPPSRAAWGGDLGPQTDPRPGDWSRPGPSCCCGIMESEWEGRPAYVSGGDRRLVCRGQSDASHRGNSAR